MLSEEVKRYRELSGDNNPNIPISRIGGYLDGYEKAMEQRTGQNVLDKIRAEILVLDDADYDFEGYYKAVTDALKIIDKYKTGVMRNDD